LPSCLNPAKILFRLLTHVLGKEIERRFRRAYLDRVKWQFEMVAMIRKLNPKARGAIAKFW